jgi:hypothetical protein
MKTFAVRVGTSGYYDDLEVTADDVWVWDGILTFSVDEKAIARFSSHTLIWAYEKDNPHIKYLDGYLR